MTRLSVAILKATGLAKADGIVNDGLLGTCDPYIKVFWEEEEIYKTEHQKRTQNPEWSDAKCEVKAEGVAAEILHTASEYEQRSEWTTKTGWIERPDGHGGVVYYNNVTKKSSGGGRFRIELVRPLSLYTMLVVFVHSFSLCVW
jgi:hypothetical protein